MTTDPADGIMFEKHNSPADDLVTEEMVTRAGHELWALHGVHAPNPAVAAALRAVAPLIAARAVAHLGEWEIVDQTESSRAVAAEREACLRLVQELWHDGPTLIAAIRARGETPTKAPGAIDWSAMDKED
jgi:hypothetical protein